MTTNRVRRVGFKKYRAVAIDFDLNQVFWEVWRFDGPSIGDWETSVASFSGKGAKDFARQHANDLNSMPPQYQP